MRVQSALRIVLPLLLGLVIVHAHLHAATLSDWNVTTPLPVPLAAHAMVANATHVYVLGGATGACTVVNTVYVAPILADGTLGAWSETTPLNSPRVFLGAALVGKWLYVVGGASGCGVDGITHYATVERAEIHLPSGTILGQWVPVASLTHGRSHMAVVTDGLHVYAVGGVDGTVTNSVEMTTVSTYGELAPWQTVAAMTVAREGLAAGIANGRLYAASGAGGPYTAPIPTTEGTTIQADGTLAPWQQMARLTDTYYEAAGAGLAGTFWITGGSLGPLRFNIPQQAICDATGVITGWTPGPSLNVARALHAAAVSGNRLYLSGGVMEAYAITSVEFAVARPAPPSPVSVGTFRPSDTAFYLDSNGNGVWDGCGPDRCIAMGLNGDVPVVGDWNGSGTTKVGTFRPVDGTFYLDYNGNGQWDGCGIDRCIALGLNGDIPVVGDWNGSGIAKVGTFRPSDGTFYLDSNGNGVWDGCGIDKCLSIGMTGDIPIVGKW